MTVISHPHYDLLKRKLLAEAGFKSISPADCRAISVLVTNKTRHCISETTLKRIYGFALSRFNPSGFTLDVLAQYCNYNSWKAFCDIKIPDETEPAVNDFDWQIFQKKLSNVTNSTLQTIRNRSGIPYHYTIKRELVGAHLNEFIHSAHTSTVLCAPAGYGKTLALCQWVEERMEMNAAGMRNDAVLFINGSSLINAWQSGRNLIEWALGLGGCCTHQQLNDLINRKQNKGLKFYLVIDAFDEHVLGAEQFELILNYLAKGLSLYQSEGWLKFVLTLRSSTWINYRHKLQADGSTWFTGFSTANNERVNVPLLTYKEVCQLCLKISPAFQNNISPETAEKLSHPLFFQYYYKQHRGNFTSASLDNVCLYELSSAFIFNNVYLGRNAAEKVFVIKSLVSLMDFKKEQYSVPLSAAAQLLKLYNQAYRNLLGIGILKEVTEGADHDLQCHIAFNNNFLEHSIAKTILAGTDNRLDAQFVTCFNNAFVNSDYKLPILKWCLIFAIKTGQQNSLEHLTGIDLSAAEKADIMLFIGNLLERECSSLKENELLLQYFKQVFSGKMFDYFFSLELINPSHKKTLLTMLRFELSADQKIILQSALGIIAVIQLDLKELKIRLDYLTRFSQDDLDALALDPVNCLEAFYGFLHNGIFPHEAFNRIDQLSFSAAFSPAKLKPCAANDMLYILGAYTMLICGDPYKVVRFVNMVKNNYKTAEIEEAKTQFAFFINLLQAEAWYGVGETDKALELFSPIAETFGADGRQLSPIIKARFYNLKIKLLMNTPREDLIIEELKCINAVADDSGNKILKMNVLMMLLKHNGVLDQYPFFKRQAVHDLTMIINRSGLNRDRFTVPDVVG
ncbi:hypothetical protein [Mucilaginibacter celer]|uniref:Uncharacterized protein n=1 Tax=Mucilaginibacter celer TaxID=2305508 RepID=A0A494VUG4_9SPHI|nr:hypothetical protein [Mucilaginibacter celer]AYL94602.1 hypothetical protein HYN43_004500 [Mucilaginibacter celer]